MSTQRTRIAKLASSCLAVSLFFGTGAAAMAASTIHPGDHLQIRVYNHPDLSTELITNSDGSATLPVAGNVNVAGLSEQAAAQRIQQSMQPFLKYPSVNVRITQQAQSIFFTGAYNGIAPFSPGETLGSAVGNLTQRPVDINANVFNATSVDTRRVRIERNGKVLPQVFNLEELSRNGQSGALLEPGDTIQLSTKPVQVQVRGNIKTPGPVYVYQGDSLAQAVSQAGGFTDSTSLSRITLVRNGASENISSGGPAMAAAAQDGDVLVLQPAIHVAVMGTVQRPGDLVLHSGNSLYAALYDAGGPAQHADMAHVKVVHDGTSSTYDLSKLARGDTSLNVPLSDGDTVVVPKGKGLDATTIGGSAAVLSSLRFLFGF